MVKRIDPRDYVVNKHAATAFEGDLEDPLTLPSGAVLRDDELDEYAETAVREARRKNLIPGRKSLSGDGSHSPTVQYRLAQEQFAAASELAEQQGISVNILARRALTEYLENHQGAA